MQSGDLGKEYEDGAIVVQQGEAGNCMFVIQEGEAEVVQECDGKQVVIATLGAGDFFGEMALFHSEERAATVRSKGRSRMLTVDKRTFLGRIHEDPSLAVRVMEKMSDQIRELNVELVRALGRRRKIRRCEDTD
jgi:CRP-like cAMP-binding protein